jgi:hypothetical protein
MVNLFNRSTTDLLQVPSRRLLESQRLQVYGQGCWNMHLTLLQSPITTAPGSWVQYAGAQSQHALECRSMKSKVSSDHNAAGLLVSFDIQLGYGTTTCGV